MLFDLYDVLRDLYLLSLDASVPLSVFDDVADIYCRYRLYMECNLHFRSDDSQVMSAPIVCNGV